mmetsp:Transcript_22207/g.28723  ORF Transcript_22207/g.28723 Transcript_22207/m.28723 type:complete len:194 (+) Transcript_22207:130-711(+)
MINFARIAASQMRYVKQVASEGALWIFPGVVTLSWLVFPAIDRGWRVEAGWTPDPESDVKMVEAAKMVRMEAYYKEKGLALPGTTAAKADDEEEEEEPEEEEAGGAADEEGEDESGDDEADADESGDDEVDAGEDDDDDEEEAPKKKTGIFSPVKKGNLTLEEQWDNFTMKAINYGDEDDDDDDEDDDDEDDE